MGDEFKFDDFLEDADEVVGGASKKEDDDFGLESADNEEDIEINFDFDGDPDEEFDSAEAAKEDAEFSAAFGDDDFGLPESDSDFGSFDDGSIEFDESESGNSNAFENNKKQGFVKEGPSEFAKSGVEDDLDLDDVWNRKTDENGIPEIDMSGMDKLEDNGDMICVAVTSGDNIVYVAHGTEGKLGFLVKFLGAALGGRLVTIKLGDENIDYLKNNPVEFRETFKSYVEA